MPDGSKIMFDCDGKTIRRLERGESVNVSRRDRARLVPGEPERIATIKKIFELYTTAGRGLKAVTDTLNKENVPTPRGPAWSHIYCGQWRDSTIRAILVNPIYRGDMVWNRRTDARFHSIADGRAIERKTQHGARLVPNAKEDWILIPNTHPPSIDRRTFEMAQTLREGRPESEKQRGRPRTAIGGWNGARSRFLLSGLIRCKLCGSRYQGVTMRKGKPRNDGSIIKNYYYGCGGYVAKGKGSCSFNPVKQESLEQLVCQQMLAFYGKFKGDAGRENLLVAVREHLGTEAIDLAEARKRNQLEQADIDRKIANLLDNISASTRDMVEQRLDELRQQRQNLNDRIQQLDQLAGAESRVTEIANDVARFINDLEFTLEHGTNVEKQTALRRAILEIEMERPANFAGISFKSLPIAGIGHISYTVVNVKLTSFAIMTD